MTVVKKLHYDKCCHKKKFFSVPMLLCLLEAAPGSRKKRLKNSPHSQNYPALSFNDETSVESAVRGRRVERNTANTAPSPPNTILPGHSTLKHWQSAKNQEVVGRKGKRERWW